MLIVVVWVADFDDGIKLVGIVFLVVGGDQVGVRVWLLNRNILFRRTDVSRPTRTRGVTDKSPVCHKSILFAKAE